MSISFTRDGLDSAVLTFCVRKAMYNTMVPLKAILKNRYKALSVLMEPFKCYFSNTTVMSRASKSNNITLDSGVQECNGNTQKMFGLLKC